MHHQTRQQRPAFHVLAQIEERRLEAAVGADIFQLAVLCEFEGVVLGAGVQIGTAFLFCPEAKTLPPHRAALRAAQDDSTVVTNVLSGRPARGLINRAIRELGPISEVVPEFPLASGALAPLHAKAQAQGSGDFSPMLAGQAAPLGRELPAGELVAKLVAETQNVLRRIEA